MLELKIAFPTQELLCFCANNGVAHGADSRFFAAHCGGLVGCCCFAVVGERLTIEGVAAKSEFGAALCDGLVRAVYQYALKLGAKTADFIPEFPAEVWNGLQEFGYTCKTDNDIDKFLTNCKNCAR